MTTKPTQEKARQFSTKYIEYLNAASTPTQELPAFATNDTLIDLYKLMSLTRAIDTKAFNLQRTGQMSTYPSSRGQEAVSVGMGHAMNHNDVLCPYYRDQGAFIQRNISIAEIYNYWGGDERGNCFAKNAEDLPVCVPIAGQFLHAAGVAFAIQYRKQQRAVVTTGGEGSTSKGDFYEALNLAGAWNLPIVFVINNNQWAISVPSNKQTGSETYAQKAIAAGVEGLQLDGNDVIAVRETIDQALQKARDGNGPTVIEAITYRLCDHTTADDATRYQDPEEVKAAWKREPVARLAYYLEEQGVWSKENEQHMQAEIKEQVETAVNEYLNTPPQKLTDLFDYLYAELPETLIDQRDELVEANTHE